MKLLFQIYGILNSRLNFLVFMKTENYKVEVHKFIFIYSKLFKALSLRWKWNSLLKLKWSGHFLKLKGRGLLNN